MTVVVVQCGQRKLAHPAPAKDLYTGPVFRQYRQAAERVADLWFIASAKHGIVEPEQVLAPYDDTLPPGGDRAWGGRVLSGLEDLVVLRAAGADVHRCRVVALCGARYLHGWAREVGAETPLAGLRLPHQFNALKRLRRST